jgi:hypothetical protein
MGGKAYFDPCPNCGCTRLQRKGDHLTCRNCRAQHPVQIVKHKSGSGVIAGPAIKGYRWHVSVKRHLFAR